MATRGPDGDDALFERLKEAVAGDSSVRQLRRRYDALRQDYEQLIGRLAELEQRLDEEERAAPPSRPLAPPSPSAAGEPAELDEVIAAPLLRLRDQYLATVTNLQTIVAGLESLAAGAFKGQHAVAPETEPASSPQRVPQRPREMRIDVKGKDFGELLDFQERLSALDGVARVSINAIDNERATLVVELGDGDE